MEEKLAELRSRLAEVQDLRAAAAVLLWDQMTCMPPGGAAARARHLATLNRLAHERFTDERLGGLLEDLRPYEESLPYDSDTAALLRVVRRDYERAVRVPPAFMAALGEHTAATYDVWTQARPADDFARVRPYLERTFALSRELAGFFPYDHPADPLIAESDYGFKAADLRAIFARLREGLVPLVRAIGERPPADDACLRGEYAAADQLAFGAGIAKAFGYDFSRGRQDQSPHPFTIGFSRGDVRITTRVRPSNLGEALFSTLHETGHALYEQGIDPALEGTPLGAGTSSGVHESQSRLWENLVGRSLGFWRHYYPRLQEIFPGQLGEVPLDAFYRAINKVQPSLIRTEADEVTYNLHVMLRFDLELALLEGSLDVVDLPAAWRDRLRSDLGVAPADDRDGVMQDVHWYMGVIGGAFQGYTLGNIMSAQFYRAALAAHPGIPGQIEEGCFDALRGWLTEHVYRHGRKFTAAELVARACGGPLDVAPYLDYLRAKYGELYRLT